MNEYWFAPIMLEQINRAIKNYEASKRSMEHLFSFSHHVRILRKKEGESEIPLLQDFIEETSDIENEDANNIYTTIDRLITMKWRIMHLTSGKDIMQKDSEENKE